MRLSNATLNNLPETVARFSYDRAAQAVGIVHFGIGAFHRAHQAWFTDLAMSRGDRDWAIAGVSMRSDAVSRQLNPQDGLYAVVEQSSAGANARVVGAVRHVIVAAQEREAVVAAVAAPTTRIVSFTVTEKGYCRTPGGDLDHALAAQGFYPLLVEAIRRRKDAGASGLTLLSCDNLASNGAQLRRLMLAYLNSEAPDLVDWFEKTCRCPSAMVDRIVPATTPDDLAAIEQLLGVDDAGAVVTESFSQWVIEDDFAAGRPSWDSVGVEMVADVAPYETAKLRMLNGAHSALAYLGLERGHVFVHQAIADPELRELAEQLMLREAALSFAPAAEQNLHDYAASLLARFANPALQHRLIQIAMDGSQKIPQRWLETVIERRAAGANCPAILRAAAAWVRHVRGDRDPVNDPLADRLAALWREAGPEGIVDALFGERGVIAPPLSEQDRQQINALL